MNKKNIKTEKNLFKFITFIKPPITGLINILRVIFNRPLILSPYIQPQRTCRVNTSLTSTKFHSSQSFILIWTEYLRQQHGIIISSLYNYSTTYVSHFNLTISSPMSTTRIQVVIQQIVGHKESYIKYYVTNSHKIIFLIKLS